MSEMSVSMKYSTLERFSCEIRNMSEDFAWARDMLKTAVEAHDGSWQGKAHDRFAERYKKLDPKLKTIADVLSSYSSSIAEIVNNEQELQKVSAGFFTAVTAYMEGQPRYNNGQSNSQYYSYREKVDGIDSIVPVGQPQDGAKGSEGWMCPMASTATMLNRKQALDGVQPSFERDAVYNDAKNKDNNFRFEHTYHDDNGNTYTTKTEDIYAIRRNMEQKGYSSREEYFKNLLDEHPEGIVVFSSYGNGGRHAVVITDYEIKPDGSIQFYVDDPVNDRDSGTGRTEIENTWFYSKNNDFLYSNNGDFRIWYISN